MIILLIILILLIGGGGYYAGPGWGYYGGGGLDLVLIIVLLYLFFGRRRARLVVTPTFIGWAYSMRLLEFCGLETHAGEMYRRTVDHFRCYIRGRCQRKYVCRMAR